MDVDTFLALSPQEMRNEVHKRDDKLFDYLRETKGAVDQSDRYWAAEVINELLDAANHGVARIDMKSYRAGRLTAKFVLDILELADRMIVEHGL